MNKDIITYIIYRLPIFDPEYEGNLSLEDIMGKFNINYPLEATQEEMAEIIVNKITKGE